MNEDLPVEAVRAAAPVDRDRTEDFEEFYFRELPRLVALAHGLAAAEIAEDLAQEAMLAAYRRWHAVKELDRPEFWVRRTCSNLAVSQFRRKLVEMRALSKLAARREQAPPLSESTEDFWAAVRRLPARQAQAAGLRYVYDMAVADIAVTMGCSVGTVKQHLNRARLALADALGADLEAAR